jgi:tetratricopeptide (TPR) repeat protein
VDHQTAQAVTLITERLKEYERSGDATAINDDETGRLAARVATEWRAAPTDAWHTPPRTVEMWRVVGHVHGYRSLLLDALPSRQLARAFAVHYLRKAGGQGQAAKRLRDLAALSGDYWPAEDDGYGRDGLLGCLRDRLNRCAQAKDASVLAHPDNDALAIALIESSLAEYPGADADPPAVDAEVWEALAWLHEWRRIVVPVPDDMTPRDENLASHYFLGACLAGAARIPLEIREGLRAAPHDYTGATAWRRMAQSLFMQSQIMQCLESLYGAMHLIRLCQDAGDGGEPLPELGYAWTARYHRTGALPDRDRAIEILRHARRRLPPADALNRSMVCEELRRTLRERFQDGGDAGDAEEAIAAAREAVGACDADALPSSLIGLAIVLMVREERREVPPDDALDLSGLEEAEQACRRALTLLSPGHDQYGRAMNELAVVLRMRYDLAGDEDALTEAESVADAGLRSAPQETSAWRDLYANRRDMIYRRAGQADGLLLEGRMMFVEYDTKGSKEALDQAIELLERAAHVIPSGDIRLTSCFSLLCSALRRKSELMQDAGLMERAVDAGRFGVAAALEGSPFRSDALSDLGNALRALSRIRSDPALFNEGLDCARKAAIEMPADHDDPGMLFTNLANALAQRARTDGSSDDLREAIKTSQRAVDVTPAEGHRRPAYLSNLGALLEMLYSWTLDADFLSLSIDAFAEAERTAPDDHPHKARYQANLARVMLTSSQAGNDDRMAAAAVAALTQAVDNTPPDHPALPGRLASLAQAHSRMISYRGPEAAQDAVRCARRAMAAAQPENPFRGHCIDSLAHALLDLFLLSGEMTVLAEAIRRARQGVQEAAGGPDLAAHQHRLATALLLLHRMSPAGPAQEEALQLLQETATSIAATPQTRLGSARRWASECAEAGDWQGVLLAVDQAFQLIPALVSRTQRRQSQQHAVSHMQGLASLGAAAALSRDDPDRAVALLELGRGTILTLGLESRGDVSALRALAPDLAGRYLDLAGEVEALAPAVVITGTPDFGALRRQADHRSEVARQFADTLAQIRNVPGLDRFMLAPPVPELCQTATEGPVIIINATRYRSDALLVTATGARYLPLPDLSLDGCLEHTEKFYAALREITDPENAHPQQAETVLFDTLTWTWNVIVSPVLDALNRRSSKDKALQRIWWCPTGPLTQLPLHAAGYHEGPEWHSCLDHVISSYTPTIRALQHARAQERLEGKPPHMLIASLPVIPGNEVSADEAIRYAANVREAAGLDTTTRANGDATRATVLDDIHRHSWVHFRCHGIGDLHAPGGSQLSLHDAAVTTTDIAAVRPERPEFAYLSACSTADHATSLLDEPSNMAAAFHLIGYAHVIGTLWEIDQHVASQISHDVYTRLRRGSHATAGIPLALHEAVRARMALLPDRPSMWAAYTHIGP